MNGWYERFTPRNTLFALSSVFPYRTCQRTYLLEQHTEQIRAFQYMYNYLNTYYDIGDPVPINGRLDNFTLQAVERFQRAVGIVADRLIGCKTWDTIKSMVARLHMYYMGMVTEGALLPLPIYPPTTSALEFEYPMMGGVGPYSSYGNHQYYID